MKDQDNDEHKKQIERSEYRAKLIEAELNAVKSSKAYKVSKILGTIKAQLASDPVGLSKKAARIIFTEPKKARHLFRSASHGALIAQSVVEQTAKYQEWILLNEPDETELETQRQQSQKLRYQPLISIITPVFNPPVEVLEELIESVLEQTYPHFELCLGNFGDDKTVQDLIDKYARLDMRIKNWVFSENKGIAFNSNQILNKASGEYIALLDHDDTLSPDALFENVKLLNEHQYDFIYSDKDKIDEEGNRFDPLFKPKLSPEMLLNINYLTHFNVMKTSIVKKVGAWDSDTDGAQDWDLFLKILAVSDDFGHIPKVLYHWRVIASSTAMSIETKPYALAGQRKAVDKYLVSQSIPAVSYHKRTELFLKWRADVLDDSPLVFVHFSSEANLARTMRSIKKKVHTPKFVVLATGTISDQSTRFAGKESEVVTYEEGKLLPVLRDFLAQTPIEQSHKTALFIIDNARFPKNGNWYEDLTGWLAIPKVAAASGRLVDKHDLIVSSGGIITEEGKYAPLFQGFPRFYQSYLGNAEWVRNLSVLSTDFTAVELGLLKQYLQETKGVGSLDDYFIWLGQSHRLVMTPHATLSMPNDKIVDWPRNIKGGKKALVSISNGTKPFDPYSNPNMSAGDPLRLFDDESLVGSVESGSHEPIDRYQHDATILAGTFDITEQELSANKNIVENRQKIIPKSVGWILPSFDAVYAGLMNIFSYADYLNTEKKLATTFYILKSGTDVSEEKNLIVEKFPQLKTSVFRAIQPGGKDKVGNHDIGIATLWSTAFVLAKANNIQRKCYFIQDNETNFYPKGSISALVEMTYKFGFFALANTEGLLEFYKRNYAGKGVVVKSKVDLSAYYPRENKYYAPQKPYKVFFYARPNMPRNAFELGIAGLKKIKEELGSGVEIITAGAAWEPKDYGVEGMFNNLGKISYEAVPKLYRSVDAGLMFMFSGHPGVTASELMASGCPVVVNEYDDVTWNELYENEKTCLITMPTASEIARNLRRCIEDQELRKILIAGGLTKAKDFYAGYEESLHAAYKAIISN